VGVEETMPFAFSDGIAQALPAARLASATPVTAGCRADAGECGPNTSAYSPADH
jgi:hypothetical protein